MNSRMEFLKVYIIPGMVFQGITVGGGYGTGREIVEYFSQYGPGAGLLGMLVTTLCMAAVLVVSFEFARRFHVYDYRSMVARLIGPGWILYEFLAVAMVLLVLAVTGSAAGHILADAFAIPVWCGVVLMFVLIVVLNFYGRDVVIRAVAFWSILLVAVFLIYFVLVVQRFGILSLAELATADRSPGWFVGGVQYAMYNVAVVPVMLYATRSIKTQSQSLISGSLAAVFAVSLGALFHLSFSAVDASVLTQSLPTHWVIKQLGHPILMTAYIIVLFGAMIQTCVGIVQGVNERLDEWSIQKRGRALSRLQHGAVAGGTIILSGALSSFGIVALVARGYGTLAWGFMLVFILPLMTVGLYQIVTSKLQDPQTRSITHE